MKSERKFCALECYALAFGLFLGLAILKFGNPVILDGKITPPVSISDYLHDPWPTHWANLILLRLVGLGVLLVFIFRTQRKWLWLLPMTLLIWQFVYAPQNVDT